MYVYIKHCVCVCEQLLAQWIPQRILPLYDKHVDQMRTQCQNSAVNATTKTTLRSWLMRTRRMYHAAGQADSWDRRCVLCVCVCVRIHDTHACVHTCKQTK